MNGVRVICVGLLFMGTCHLEAADKGAAPEVAAPATVSNAVVQAPGNPRPRRVATAKWTKEQKRLEALRNRPITPVVRPEDMNQNQHDWLGAYDAELLESIHRYWTTLLHKQNVSYLFTRVRLDFTLHPDGNISDLVSTHADSAQIAGHTCEKVILDLCPFAAWPGGMKQQVGANERRVSLTFWYGARHVPYEHTTEPRYLVAEFWEQHGQGMVDFYDLSFPPKPAPPIVRPSETFFPPYDFYNNVPHRNEMKDLQQVLPPGFMPSPGPAPRK